jgi:hypothetical protein
MPDCAKEFPMSVTKGVLDAHVVNAWESKMREHTIKNKVYCPNKYCSYLLDGDALVLEPGTGAVRCTACELLFCPRCKVPNHYGLKCEEVISEDKEVYALAEQAKWKSCPACCHMAELMHGGCFHVLCICGEEYCYACGIQWDKELGRCSSGQCVLWDERILIAEGAIVEEVPVPVPVEPPVAVGIRRFHFEEETVPVALPALAELLADIPHVESEETSIRLQRNYFNSGFYAKSRPKFIQWMEMTNTCHYCNTTLRSAERLAKHLARYHAEFECCGKMFAFERTLNHHKRMKHGIY